MPALPPGPGTNSLACVVDGMSRKQVLNPVVITEKYIVLWDSAKSSLRLVVQSLKLALETEEELVRGEDAGGGTAVCTGLGVCEPERRRCYGRPQEERLGWLEGQPGPDSVGPERRGATGNSRAGICCLERWPRTRNVCRRQEQIREAVCSRLEGGAAAGTERGVHL